MKKIFIYKRAFTLIELMVTIAISTIVVLAMGSVLADGHRGYNQMYNRVFSPVVQDAYTARLGFDAVARKATIKKYKLGALNNWVQLYYFSNPTNPAILEPDRYAIFAVTGNNLTVNHFVEATDAQLSSQVLATTVQKVWFDVPNVCVQMQLELGDGKQSLTVTCSSIRHNEE